MNNPSLEMPVAARRVSLVDDLLIQVGIGAMNPKQALVELTQLTSMETISFEDAHDAWREVMQISCHGNDKAAGRLTR